MTIEIDLARRALILQIETDLSRRLLVVPRRPDKFDPVSAAPEQLALYGLPPRPATSQPTYKLWYALVTTPLQAIERLVPDLPLVLPGFDHQLNFNRLALIGGSHQQTSRNWSGAVTTAAPGRPYQTVYGHWQVPAFRAPAGARNGETHACSTWIGLDGHRRSSNSLPQIGTTQSVTLVSGVPQVQLEAWWQWWMRGHRNPPQPFANFPLAIDDEIICSLEVRDPYRVVFNIANLTQGIAMPPKDVLAPVEFPPPGGTTPPVELFPVRGQAAEWIAERPTIWNSDRMYPLPDFDPVTFEPCLAASGAPHIGGLRSARLLRMVGPRPAQPRGGAVLSRPTRHGRYRLDVTCRM